MGYDPETAGRIMTTKFITLRREMTVEVALAKIRRQAKEKETIYSLYVTDDGKKLLGTLTLEKLILSEPNELIGDIMNDTIIKVSTGTEQEEVAKAVKTFDLLAIPVVDNEDRIVGIVTVDDIIDIVEEEATEYIFDQAGLADFTGKESSRSEILVSGSIWKIWKIRLPFLFITLAFGIVSGFVMSRFEEALASVVAVMFFIPVIMDIGGSVGTQSSTVFARGSALGHIQIKNFGRHLTKEVLVGVSIGLVAGIIGGLVTLTWQTMAQFEGANMLALSVGIAIFATSTLASFLGFLIPWILVKLNADQAAGAAPIITSIKDIAGLLIYFTIVTLLMNQFIQ
jgi:magnesium transporter